MNCHNFSGAKDSLVPNISASKTFIPGEVPTRRIIGNDLEDSCNRKSLDLIEFLHVTVIMNQS